MYDFGIGIDIEKIDRFNDCINDKSFLQKIFTKKEIEFCSRIKNPAPHLAARFCAKEAVIKAFGSCQKQVSFRDIEIFNDDKGAPYAVVKKYKNYEAKISMSHDESNAAAISFIIKHEKNNTTNKS